MSDKRSKVYYLMHAYADMLDFFKVREKKVKSYADYRRMFCKTFGVNDWAGKCFNLSKNLRVHELSNKIIQELEAKRREEGLKTGTINFEMAALRQALNHARKRIHDCKMPDDHLDWPIGKVQAKTRSVSMEEEREIQDRLAKMAEFNSSTYGKNRTAVLAHDLYLMQVDGGCRIGESTGIHFRDIDWEDGTIEIFRSKVEHTSQRFGTISMTPRVKEMIRRRKAAEGLKGDDLLFPRWSNAYRLLLTTIDEVCNTDEEVVRRHGKATVHSLRDTFATRLVRRGVSLKKVQTLLGHASPAMTAKYVYLEEKDTSREAAAVLHEYVNERRNDTT